MIKFVTSIHNSVIADSTAQSTQDPLWPVLSERLRMEVNTPGSLTIKVPYNNMRLADRYPPIGLNDLTILEMRRPDGTVAQAFRGRVRSIATDRNRSVTFEAEGIVSALHDSVIPPFVFPDDFLDDPAYQIAAASGNVVRYLLNWLLTQHNAQARAQDRVYIGDVTVTDPNNYIARSTSAYMSTMDVIRTRLLDSALGGMYVARYTRAGTYLDYLSGYDTAGEESRQPIVYGENMLDVNVDQDADELYTDIVPIGADGLTIASLPDGELPQGLVKSGDRIYNPTARTLYGQITRIVEWPDVTVAANLRTKAASALLAAQPIRLITVSAIDKGLTDDNVDLLTVGKTNPVTSPMHGLTGASFGVASVERDILRPGETRVSLGCVAPTQTAAVAELQSKEK